jgi:hypothetical protein
MAKYNWKNDRRYVVHDNEMTIDADGQPRISSRALARLLGMSDEDLVRLMEENRAEIEKFGPIVQTESEPEEPTRGPVN